MFNTLLTAIINLFHGHLQTGNQVSKCISIQLVLCTFSIYQSGNAVKKNAITSLNLSSAVPSSSAVAEN